MDQTAARPRPARSRHAFSKVPEITAFFWIVKALTTAMGESTSDFLVHTLVPEIAVVLGGIAFAIALYLQFGKDRYVPWAYWLAVAMVGVFGTMAADVLHVGLGVPYIASTIFYAIVLAAVFRLWYVSEGTLSIHSITTPRRELFYWAAVLATFALGTAAGDLTAVTLGLGYSARSSSSPPSSPCRHSATSGSAGTRSSASGSPTSSPAPSAPRSPTGSPSPTLAAASPSAPARSA
jgi:uncharacterized membrane-anchored protein